MRNLSPQAIDQKDKDYNRPIELYEIYLDEETLRFCNFNKNIDFYDQQGNPAVFYAAPIKRSQISKSDDGKVDEVSLSIANANKMMSSYVAHTKLQGRGVSIYKLFLDADQEVTSVAIFGRGGYKEKANVDMAGLLSPDNAVELFSGEIDSFSVTSEAISISVTSKLNTLDKELPNRIYNTNCTWPAGFGGESCGYDVPIKSSTIDSISSDHMTIYDDAITEESDYWKYGYVKINGESRFIEESGAGYVKLEYPLPADAVAGDDYSLKAGCDKGYSTPHGCQYWGNEQFYGGFLSIPRIRDIRNYG